MARYIDADKLFTWLDIKNRSKHPIGDAKQYNTLLIYEVFDEIDDAETEDVAPVVHAYNKSKDSFLCSACTFGDFGLFNHGGRYTPNYCPNCGAKMDEEVSRCSSSK